MPLPRIFRRLLWVWGFFLALFVALLFVGLFLPSVSHAPTPDDPDHVPNVRLTDPAGTVLTLPVEIATTPEQQRDGLMNRPVVTTGMLFVFEDDAPRSFWMKNTLVPLDISFFASDGSWVSSARMQPCAEDPCVSYPSAKPARYALELPAGGIGASIGEGWTIDVGATF